MTDSIHETATLTSKGQVTLPKSIRQALGVGTGGKIAFELRGGEVIVTRADAVHEDPAIGDFLDLLVADIHQARNIGPLPEELARAMREHANAFTGSLDDAIEGDVDL
jgi:antitoxin PrlF